MTLNKRRLLLGAFDVVCFWIIAFVLYGLSVIITNGPIAQTLASYLINLTVLFLAIFAFRLLFGTYHAVWRYTSTLYYFRLVIADIAAGLFTLLVNAALDLSINFWSILLITALITLAALSSRLAYRLLYKHLHHGPQSYRTNVAIIGAGELGHSLVNELALNPHSQFKPACFIDTDPNKIGATVSGIKVLSHAQFVQRKEEYEISEVVIAISKLTEAKLSELNTLYVQLGCKVHLYDLPLHTTGENDGKRVIREFQIEDLLFRDPLTVSSEETRAYFRGKAVLVTGGGGSIGSELCRQIAKCSPKKLIIFDIYENNAYNIQQELIRQYGSDLNLSVEIGSVRDVKRLDYIFNRYRPDIVFHAAAHKHVPLMEDSPCEAIKNNVIGTHNTANAAEKYGVRKFILISTDKAVNPTNIMGASKRLCEMIVQCRRDSATSFAAVRFGNVLGSNGSVIPLFKQQIANGGPVTVTDKRIIRYFMTIPEASQLVMTAGAMAEKGELFVLDMGKPVKIYDLAVNMIKLSGLVPDVDIEIKEIGLRPGEKLFEELLIKTETLDKTPNNMIFIERDEPYTREEIEEKLTALRHAVAAFEDGEFSAVKTAMKACVATFKDPEDINRSAESSSEMQMVKTEA